MESYKEIVDKEILEDILTKSRKRRKFKITVCFRETLSEKSKEAVILANSLKTYWTEGDGKYKYHCVAFLPEDVEILHELWELVNNFEYKKVFINNYRLPYSQSLWLLLFWINRIK
jgi:hypothetical protein